MADEIETAAELIEFAELSDVVIHELAATRDSAHESETFGQPPEELHAPSSHEEFAALNFGIRQEGTELGLRCRIQTCNAYGSFHVDAEAVFSLPAPISPTKPEIVPQFAEQVGVPTLFPYIRTAVAALASQMSVPATPLPLLRAGELTLTAEEEVSEQQGPAQEPDDIIASGTLTRTNEDGTVEHIGEFFIDARTGSIVRIGGEGQTPEADELLDAWAAMPPPDEMTVDWMVRNHGEESTRAAIEQLRAAGGDEATDAMLVEIDKAVARIAAEDAFGALSNSIAELADQFAAAQERTEDAEPHASIEIPNDLPTFLQAAENVVVTWADVIKRWEEL